MSSDPRLEQCVSLLADLIGFRTHNPGGDELALCERLRDEFLSRAADEVELVVVERPLRGPGGYVYARYGEPRFLINVHLDTVPPNSGFTRDPFVAQIEDGRVYGLGSADTKGAIAAALTALATTTPRDVGILFSGDEENGSQCMRHFAASDRIRGIERALVCEPTNRRAGVRHRGLRAYRAHISGRGGHSSRADHMPKPVVAMARLAVSLDQLGAEYLGKGPPDMPGLCMNVASIDGGVAFNVIPDEAALSFSIRPPPGFDADAFERELAARVGELSHDDLTLEVRLAAEPFSCRDEAWFRGLLGDRVRGYISLDFWTEAALLSDHGVDAVVLGPGDIAHAHAPDEFVPVADLSWAIDLFTHALQHHSPA